MKKRKTMTVAELYRWAQEHEAENAVLVVYDCNGTETSQFSPELFEVGGNYAEVKLLGGDIQW